MRADAAFTFTRRRVLLAAGLLLGAAFPARAAEKINVVASFSILADLVRNVGGDRVDVTALVGPNSDAHVYTPAPVDAKKVAQARLIVINGLGLEGWMTRLIEAAGSKATVVTASSGVTALTKTADGTAHIDPHAWQSVANVKLYVANIRDGLAKADPANAGTYATNALAYLAKLDALDAEIKTKIAAIPPARRTIVTSHDAFAYFAAAYGVRFIAPEGVTTEQEASARDLARIIIEIKREDIRALFVENVSDPRLMQQVARESGAKIDGTLYADALSPPAGPAATYIDMMRNNLRQLAEALQPSK